jgi:glycosyltransferase involved in cell wall biosynthesis
MFSPICEVPTLATPVERERVVELCSAPSAPVRVLHVINGQHYSGAERVQDLLALNLPGFGFDVSFACLRPGRFAAMRQARQALLFEMEMKSRFDLRPVWRLARLIRNDHYALVHTHTPRAVLIGRLASALAGVPLVHHLHSPTASDSTRAGHDRWNAWIERRSLSGASGVIAVSNSLAAYAANQGIDKSRISVVPNGVPARGPLVDRGPPEQTWTLGTVALFRPRKGLEVLLESVALLRSQGSNVRLRAVGEFETADYERKIHKQVERLAIGDLVDWRGFTPDVAGELATMDLFVLPSLFGEGLPMVILEAMAAGLPIVATRVEGVPEAIRDRVEGLIARPSDPEDLARAIARYVRGQADWSRIRACAHARQAERFSDRSMAAGVAEVYTRVLG